jgi:hypothetical protein
MAEATTSMYESNYIKIAMVVFTIIFLKGIFPRNSLKNNQKAHQNQIKNKISNHQYLYLSVSCLKTGRVNIHQININLYYVPRIIVFRRIYKLETILSTVP